MDNQNLGDIIRNDNNPTNTTGMPNTDPMAAIRQATGLDLNVEDFKTQVNEQINPTPTATPRVTGGIGVLTPEEAAQLKSDGNYQRIDVEHEAMLEQEKKRIKREQQQQSDMNGLLDEALNDEAVCGNSRFCRSPIRFLLVLRGFFFHLQSHNHNSPLIFCLSFACSIK